MAGRTRKLEPEEVGAPAHVREVEKTIKGMMGACSSAPPCRDDADSAPPATAEAQLAASDVHLILVKCPLLTSSKISAIRAKGIEPITSDTYSSMGSSRYATALGIAVALGEMDGSESSVVEGLSSDGERWSARASCSSGAELDDCHILLLAQEKRPVGPQQGRKRLGIKSGYMKDSSEPAPFRPRASSAELSGSSTSSTAS